MKYHLLCLTIDTDPDGLNALHPDRGNLEFRGLAAMPEFRAELDARRAQFGGEPVPVTWFIRADGQLRRAFGDALYLVRRYEKLWQEVLVARDELAWHPHLYRSGGSDGTEILTDPVEAAEELERTWTELTASSFFAPKAFRNGEGWHTRQTLAKVEQLGFAVDSTAIPGRTGPAGHPMDWIGAPNQPYYPDPADIRRSVPRRGILELPMSTWRFQASYDRAPKVRYIDPAVHEELFASGLEDWERYVASSRADLLVWIMVFHPGEVLPRPGGDLLFAHSREAVYRNVRELIERIHVRGDSFEFTTVSAAAERWRAHREESL